MTKAQLLERLDEIEAEVHELLDKVDAAECRATDAEAELDDQVEPDLVEVECLRCHKRFTSTDETRYCTNDCRLGWTPAPTFEQWYRTMHPAWQGENTGTDPINV